MRSIEAKFAEAYKDGQAGISTYIAFVRAIRGQCFSEDRVTRWFNKLVDKQDYAGVPKSDVMRNVLLAFDP